MIRDHLGFWAERKLNGRQVAKFLSLDKRDVARIAHVAPSSIHWDGRIPKEVLERLTEIAVTCGQVALFFEGDGTKTALWFRTKNPLLGDLSPRDMLRFGRHEQLRRFILEALDENGIEVPAWRLT